MYSAYTRLSDMKFVFNMSDSVILSFQVPGGMHGFTSHIY